ncbi:hypothetical protein HMPREF9372_0906 [Sporosarcina newyorkensis 2681]|uniref:Uncharacterized protein n=1 Tax=Sporosarcina newyorkensis 2681 TaxID=1027292 RepID=F9DQ26_9BACL|nr:hypothetical protein HMPREF9372_0906 [Sporosarcina newyorkensis 2681]
MVCFALHPKRMADTNRKLSSSFAHLQMALNRLEEAFRSG